MFHKQIILFALQASKLRQLIMEYKNKKDVRLVVLRPHILGIAKRLNQMNFEETIFPRRDIYVGNVQNTHYRHIHRMSIDCSGPWFKILANLRYVPKTKCFLASVDFSSPIVQIYN